MLNYKRYKRNPVVDYPEREWPNKEIEKAPVWCSVELKDGFLQYAGEDGL